jgi:LPXTG-motif cell wall-anchored protein
MRRYTVAALATAVAASLIAPQAILAEQPLPPPDAAGNSTTPEPGLVTEDGDGSAEVTGGTAAELAAEPTLRTSLARQAPRSATASARPAATVVMKDFYFSPKTVTIDVGESVKWDNKGKAEEGHTATGDSFDSGVLKPGESYTHKFSTVGTFDYICTLHSSMKGTVVVSAGSGGGGGDGSGGGSGDGGDGSAGASGSSGSSGGGASTSSDPGSSSGSSSGFSTSSGSGSSGSLPSTGLDLALLALLGVDLLLAGALGLLRWRSSQPG